MNYDLVAGTTPSYLKNNLSSVVRVAAVTAVTYLALERLDAFGDGWRFWLSSGLPQVACFGGSTLAVISLFVHGFKRSFHSDLLQKRKFNAEWNRRAPVGALPPAPDTAGYCRHLSLWLTLCSGVAIGAALHFYPANARYLRELADWKLLNPDEMVRYTERSWVHSINLLGGVTSVPYQWHHMVHRADLLSVAAIWNRMGVNSAVAASILLTVAAPIGFALYHEPLFGGAL